MKMEKNNRNPIHDKTKAESLNHEFSEELSDGGERDEILTIFKNDQKKGDEKDG